jgi:hypothetical protein
LGGKARDVTAWPGEALDIACADRIGHDRDTIGTVLVACRTGATAALVKAMTTSGSSAINSVADLRVRLGSPADQR